MKDKEEWKLAFKIEIEGEDFVGEGYNHDGNISIPLLAKTADEAHIESQKHIKLLESADLEDLQKLDKHIDGEDVVSLSNFRLVYTEKIQQEKIIRGGI